MTARLLMRAIRQCSSVSGLQNGYDVVIAGGGIMGCASAFFLAKRMPPERIIVIERDPKYTTASTVLSVGSIRQQFSSPVNIALSQHSFQFLDKAGQHLMVDLLDPPDIQFVHGGYLFLSSPEGQEILQQTQDEKLYLMVEYK